MKEFSMNEIPKWDVALEAVAKDKFEKLGRPMNLENFKDLGNEYKIRFDDLMHTLSQLVTHEAWSQQGFDEQGQPVSDDHLSELFVYNRLDEEIAEKYSVVWQPVAGSKE
jgi:hypothetical protein